jgi:YD repeat-containing protein
MELPRARFALRPLVLAALASFGAACASNVVGVERDAAPGDAPAAAAPVGDGPCAHWALTDREEVSRGEVYTDLHRTFSPAGELLRERGHIRTGGHGIDRTYYEYEYRWSERGLIIARADEPDPGTSWVPASLTTFVLDGESIVSARSERPGIDTQSTSYERDAAGRVTEHTVERVDARTPGGSSREHCAYEYDTAGRLRESRCDDGQRTTWQWEGERLVRRERRYRDTVGVHESRWDAQGRLASTFDDDGYGPGRGWQTFYVYDDAGRVVREESADAAGNNRSVRRAFFYDSMGRLAREESYQSGPGAEPTVTTWERDERGRPTRFVGYGGTPGVYSYEESPGRVTVTLASEGTSDPESHTRWSYQCFANPPRIAPVAPLLDVPVVRPTPEVEHYPVREHQY